MTQQQWQKPKDDALEILRMWLDGDKHHFGWWWKLFAAPYVAEFCNVRCASYGLDLYVPATDRIPAVTVQEFLQQIFCPAGEEIKIRLSKKVPGTFFAYPVEHPTIASIAMRGEGGVIHVQMRLRASEEFGPVPPTINSIKQLLDLAKLFVEYKAQ